MSFESITEFSATCTIHSVEAVIEQFSFRITSLQKMNAMVVKPFQTAILIYHTTCEKPNTMQQKALLCTILLSVALSALSIASAETGKNNLDKAIDAVAKDRFEKMPPPSGGKPEDFYGWRTTPTFPASWPPLKGTRLVAYVYGYALNTPCSERQIGPWLQVLVDPNNSNAPTFQDLKYDRTKYEIQGFEPIMKPEAESDEADRKKAQQLLIEISKGKNRTHEDDALLRRYYQRWRQYNGVMYERIAPYQKNFFDWLEKAK